MQKYFGQVQSELSLSGMVPSRLFDRVARMEVQCQYSQY